MEQQQEYLDCLGEIAQINDECLQIWQEIPHLKRIDETKSGYKVIKKITFSVTADKLWALNFVTEEKIVDFSPELCHCFNDFKNPLKTNLPRLEYHDLKEELEIYKLLIPKEGLPIAECLLNCLKRVRDVMNGLRKTLTQEGRLVRRIFQFLQLETSDQTFWTLRSNSDLESFNFGFSLIINDQSVDLLQSFNLPKLFERTLDLPPFIESTLLIQDRHKRLIKTWIEEEMCATLPKVRLLWKGVRDGFEISTFHRLCDNQGPTVLIVKANNFLFGGYSHSSWSSSQGWKSDKNCFLFSLNKETKLKQPGDHDPSFMNSIHNSPNHGPLFGASHDLYIADRSNMNHLSSSCLGYSYQVPHGCVYGDHSSYLFFCGERNFQVQDIEVWQVAQPKTP